MRILFINGLFVQFTLRELLLTLQHPRFVAYVGLALLTMIWLEPYQDVAALPVAEAVLVWAHGLVGFTVIYLGALTVTRALGWRLISPLVMAAIGVYNAYVGSALAQLLGAPEIGPHDMMVRLAFNMVLLLMLELGFVSFVIKGIQRDIGAQAPMAGAVGFMDMQGPSASAKAPYPHQMVTLLGRSFPLEDLHLITAEEHYVLIVTRDGRKMLRGRISDIEAQLPASHGLRVHRSHWVAASAVRRLNRDRDGWTLTLTCGAEIPVARARRAMVQDWVGALTIA
jgi:hypothetical protein